MLRVREACARVCATRAGDPVGSGGGVGLTARRLVAGSLAGFASFLTVTDYLLWGRAFLPESGVGLFGTDDILLWYSVPALLATAAALAVPLAAGRLSKRGGGPGRLRADALAALGTSCLFGALVLLECMFVAGLGILPMLVAVALLAGVGVGASLLAWQCLFAAMEGRLLARSVLGSCVLFPLVAMGCTFLPRLAECGTTCALLLVSCVLRRRVVRACAGGDLAAESWGAGSEPAGLRAILPEWGPTALCLGSLGFVTGISRTLTLSAVQSGTGLVLESLACIFAVALLLVAVWAVRGELLPPTTFYQIAFPVVATGFVAFSIVQSDFTSSFAGLSYFWFELALIVAIVQTVQTVHAGRVGGTADGDGVAGRDGGSAALGSAVAYGFVTGSAYLALGLGTVVGIALRRWVAGGTFPLFFVVVIVCLYALSIPLVLQVRRRPAAPPQPQGGPGTGAGAGSGAVDTGSPADTGAGVGLSDVYDVLGRHVEALSARYGLTRREREVLAFILLGNDSPTIAERLTLSDNTVRSHKKNLYRKLGIHSKQELLELIGSERNATTEV